MKNRSLLQQPPPICIASIRQPTKDLAISNILNAQAHGARGINLHLSFLDEQYQNYDSIKEIISYTTVSAAILNYSVKLDGSVMSWSDEERLALSMEGLRAGGDVIDIQGYSFDPDAKAFYTKENPFASGYSFLDAHPKEVTLSARAIEQQCALIEAVHAMGKEVLLSTHAGVPLDRDRLTELCLYLEKRHPDIIKIVTLANTEEEMFETFHSIRQLQKEIRTPVHLHASGKYGPMTRIICPILGSKFVFCNDEVRPGVDYTQPNLALSVRIMDAVKQMF
ncbi:MAG: type I 3-dehydroquinate dehydratase [Eubacteriales bacterium]